MVTEHHKGFTSTKCKPEPNSEFTPRFKLTPFEDISMSLDDLYRIDGIIPREGLTLVYGPAKKGKSFTVLDMMMHVALGWKFRDRHVEQGSVVYITLEGANGFKGRVQAFRKHWLADHTDPVPFFLITGRLDLIKDHSELVQNIRVQTSTPNVVVIDTLNRSLAGSESDDEDMGDYVKAAAAIQEAFGCAVIVVHHCGHEGTRPRGHSLLLGAVDAQLSVKLDDATKIVTMTVEQMKDGENGASFSSQLEKIALGLNRHGLPVTSCIVVPVDEADVLTAKPKAPVLTPKQKLALEALTEALLASGEPVPSSFGLPSGLKAVAVEAWRQEMMRRGVIASDAGNPREEFRRLRDQLASKHLIGQQDGLVWKV